MKNHCIVFFVIALITLVGCASNKTSDKEWYRGNLHAHSYWSDGNTLDIHALDWYKNNGYHFAVLSDHNILAEGERFKTITANEENTRLLDSLAQIYGEDLVNYQIDSNKIRIRLNDFEAYQSTFQDDSFIVIESEEISDACEHKPIHLNALNLDELIPPQKGQSITETIQNNINAVLEAEKKSGKKILCQLNHPNFGWAITAENLYEIENLRFFELYNGHPSVHNMGDSAHLSVEDMWDKVNIHYVSSGKPLLYGLATDDTHHYHNFQKNRANPSRGWVMVLADSLETNALMDAMNDGNFYASTGVVLEKLQFDKSNLQLRIKPEEGITYLTQILAAVPGTDKMEILASIEGEKVSYKISGEYLFIRARIMSSKDKENAVYDHEKEMAWTQPVK